jgi:hypothetical protein
MALKVAALPDTGYGLLVVIPATLLSLILAAGWGIWAALGPTRGVVVISIVGAVSLMAISGVLWFLSTFIGFHW